MPAVAAFRGLHYASDRFGSDISDLVCPPYDVIDAAQRHALLALHPRNAVRLELNPDADPHRAASETLAEWRADGTLERRVAPAVYRYAHARARDPDRLAVHGSLARVLLEPWGGGVRPHEHTLPGPKADRLALLRATRTQLSPILAIYFDASPTPEAAGSQSNQAWQARDGDGLLHALAALEPDDALANYLSRQQLFVADGHHRYETALAYQAEVRAVLPPAKPPRGALGCDWTMMVLVNAAVEALEIRPTHRIVLEADPEALRALARNGDPLFQAMPIALERLPEALEERRDLGAPVFGLVLPGGEGRLLVGDPVAIAARMTREPLGPAVRMLDLAVLHAAILDERLGIGPDAVAAEERLLYTRDPAEALDRVTRGDARAAFLVRRTRLEQLAEVARAGEVMPQKSTYFYPKLLTGLVFNPLED